MGIGRFNCIGWGYFASKRWCRSQRLKGTGFERTGKKVGRFDFSNIQPGLLGISVIRPA
jgi:hypothetical protein